MDTINYELDDTTLTIDYSFEEGGRGPVLIIDNITDRDGNEFVPENDLMKCIHQEIAKEVARQEDIYEDSKFGL